MNSNKKDVFVGFIIILIIIAGIFFYKKYKTDKAGLLSLPTPISFQKELENSFKFTIPDDVDSVELKDVTGGESRAIATKKFKDRLFSHTVLADLPDLSANDFYEGWLVNGDKVISTGKMKLDKGGFMLEYNSKIDYSEYKTVVITLEKIFDNKPEIHILEGSFK